MAKATDAVKPWEAQPPGTLRCRGRGTQGQSNGELERPSSAGAVAHREGVGAGHSTATRGWDNTTLPEGRPRSRTVQRKEFRSVIVQATRPPSERMTELQSKLYQAAKRDPTRRFYALHDKLALPYVLQTAWEAVRSNDGAPGIDQQTLGAIEAQGVPEFLAQIAQSLREKTYRPQPVRRALIPKGAGKTRPLGIPTVRDRVVQAAAKLLLEPIFEADFEGTSFGFRPERGQQEALAAVRQNARAGCRWVVEADLECFFDTLDHQTLMSALRRRISDGEMLRLIYRWLKAGYLLEGVYHDTDQGSPQGGVLSPLLANVYLHGFDQAQRTQKAFLGRLTRFADDFIIQCGSAEQAGRALEWVREQLGPLRLTLHPEKTRVVNDREEGFDFLGFHHHRVFLRQKRRASWGVLRWPSRSACGKFREEVRQRLGSPGRTRQEWNQVRQRLRQYLEGWVHYYRHGESSRVFAKLDDWVQERVARHLARSQPRGPRRRRRCWVEYARLLEQTGQLPRLTQAARVSPRPYRGRAKVRWRAG
jgi:RNA-directed DNA polymerase